ncbi:putative reverse transcriptase zinc-binding domain-containing protein [Lupinus albus]|uniref:Putative reverse transcriptase zinc-binding domain-containing protein n=1 Tax=Lupinus albus TaxID=3870 RepID=A0A6A4PPG1_LUPAL|nr:putative reverse transcriptase zinc-binding domain-containing protein [Lupinus albus]
MVYLMIYVVLSYIAQLNHQQSPIGKKVNNCWINCVPLNICCFVWKLIRMGLPTNDELFKRNVIVRVDEMLCIFCNNHVEIIDHLFASCDFVVSICK